MRLAGRDMGVLDADSHFQEPVTWLADIDETLARQCPGQALLVGTANFVGVDPHCVPGTPFWNALTHWAACSTLADVHGLLEDDATASFFSAKPFDAEERTRWLDMVGIDHQICNPTVAAHMQLGITAVEPALAASVTHAYNEWAAAATRGWRRLHPTTLVDVYTGRGASPNLESVAESGSLTFLVPIDEAVWGGFGNDSLAPLWREGLDLGLTAVMHLGVAWPTGTPPQGSVSRWADTQLRAQRCFTQVGGLAPPWRAVRFRARPRARHRLGHPMASQSPAIRGNTHLVDAQPTRRTNLVPVRSRSSPGCVGSTSPRSDRGGTGIK